MSRISATSSTTALNASRNSNEKATFCRISSGVTGERGSGSITSVAFASGPAPRSVIV
jgi:hypothetical protein